MLAIDVWILSIFFLFFCLFAHTEDSEWIQKLVAQKVDPEMLKMLEDMKNNTECCGKSTTQKPNEVLSKDKSMLYIFMSFSVPKQVWVDLWKQVDRIPFQFVLRGLPDNSFQKLAEKVKDYGCSVSISPDLFDKFGVTAVPTFIRVKDGVAKGVSGNISLEYAMRHL